MNIYLVRHGETHLNISGVFYGHMDCDINDRGISQAKYVGELLKSVDFDLIYTSPLMRAKRTVEIILEAKKTFSDCENEYQKKQCSEPEIDKRLMEIGFGLWEGLNLNEIISMDKEVWESYYNGWPEVSPPLGESFRDFYDRVKDFFDEKINSIKEKDLNVLIVAHHGPLALMPIFALGLDLNDYWKFKIDQGVYSVITSDEKGYVLNALNCSR